MNNQIDTYFITREVSANSPLVFQERIYINFPFRRMTIEFGSHSSKAAARENDENYAQRLICRELNGGNTLAVSLFGSNGVRSSPTELKFKDLIQLQGVYTFQILGSAGEVDVMTRDVSLFIKLTFYSE